MLTAAIFAVQPELINLNFKLDLLASGFYKTDINVDTGRQIFWEAFSWQIYLLSEFLPEICWEEIA